MPSTPSICVFSIDHVPPVAGVKRQAAVSDSTLAQICRQLASAKLPATLALAAAPSEELRFAIEQHGTCEVALLAAPWAVAGSSRSQFSQSLAAGLDKLSAAGVPATTLVVPSGKAAAHDDVLVKHGITAARVGQSRVALARGRGWWQGKRSRPAACAIHPLRWGLWEAVVNINLAEVGLSGARRLIDRIASQGGIAMIAADAAMLANDAKLLSRLIEHLQRRRDDNSLVIDSLVAAVKRQQAPRYAPARSILHSAAA